MTKLSLHKYESVQKLKHSKLPNELSIRVYKNCNAKNCIDIFVQLGSGPSQNLLLQIDIFGDFIV